MPATDKWTLAEVLAEVGGMVPKKVPYNLAAAILGDAFRSAGGRVDDVFVDAYANMISPEEVALVGWLAQAHLSPSDPRKPSKLAMALSSAQRRPTLGRRTLERWVSMVPMLTFERVTGDSAREEEAIRKWLGVCGVSIPGETKDASLRRLAMIDSTAGELAMFSPDEPQGSAMKISSAKAAGLGITLLTAGLVYGLSEAKVR